MDIPPFAAEHARRRLERLAFQVNSTTRSPVPEAVHELRVAIRRSIQALTVFKACFPRRETKRVRKELKEILTAAGAVRDCDIAAKVLSKIQPPGSAALAQQFRTDRKVKEKSLIALLKRWAARKSISKWCNGLELGAPRPFPGTVESLARRMLRGIGKEFFKSGGQAAAAGNSGEHLHDFRILAKKFRYTLELFSPACPSALDNQIGRIKEIQSLLGAINDYQTVRNMVAASREQPRLEAELKKSQNQRTRKFRKLWTGEFSGPGLAKQWVADFDAVMQPSRKPVTRSRRATASAAVAAKAPIAAAAGVNPR